MQALFDALGGFYVLDGCTLILGGDGRYYNKKAIQVILEIAAANGISHVVVGQNGILTTPAVSGLIPVKSAIGGIILTASHNPGGIDGDWGVKYNTESGGPALNDLTDSIHRRTLAISEYQRMDLAGEVDISTLGCKIYNEGKFIVEVVDPVDEYLETLETIFDFNAVRNLIARPDFSLLFDAMHASTGQYARRILVEELGAPAESILNGTPLEDFGGTHPDPNLTYASELVERLNPERYPDAPQFGAASDGDGDRNMILGRGVFVNPADSVAVIAANAIEAIPYFAKRGVLKGVARSMPTAGAVDRVAESLGIPCFETPTGWKYFANLMDTGQVSICGEESFGTSSDHIREKDGLWAVLAWLSILACKNRDTAVGSLVTVQDILVEHWRRFGRNFTMRHDYENVSSEAGNEVMKHLRNAIVNADLRPASVTNMDEFEYVDPVDYSVASQQGVRIYTENGGRIVVRLSGTGSVGATIRVYFELHKEASQLKDDEKPADVLASLVDVAEEVTGICALTGRDRPSVIT